MQPTIKLPAEFARRSTPFIECTQIYLPGFLAARAAGPLLVQAAAGKSGSSSGRGLVGGVGVDRPQVQPQAGEAGCHWGRVGPVEARCCEGAGAHACKSIHLQVHTSIRPSAASATLRGKRTQTHLQDVPRGSQTRGILETTELARTASPWKPIIWYMSGISIE